MTDEIWKPIPGFDNYEASNLGRIRSVDHTDRRGRNIRGRILKAMGTTCYVQPLIDGAMGTVAVGSLVLRAFVGPPKRGQRARHYNSDYYDNRVENVAWGSYKELFEDSIRNGKRDPAANVGNQFARGHVVSDEARERIGAAHRGKKVSRATRAKMSASQKG